MRATRFGGLKTIAAGFLAALTLAAAGAFAQPINDACSSAAEAQIGFYYESTTDGATVDGTSGCPDSDSPDVWFRFTPEANTRLAIYTCLGTSYDSLISLHTGCPGTSGNEIACDDDFCFGPGGPSRIDVDVLGGQTYYVRVSGYNDPDFGVSTGSYGIAFEDLGGGATATPSLSPTPSPSPTGPFVTPSPSPSPTPGGHDGASDACADAPAVQVETVYQGTTVGATLDGSTTCDGGNGVDVWFKFTATESKNLSFNLCNVNYDAVFSLHSGCPGTAANTLACSDDGCGQSGGGGFISGPVQAGSTYFFRLSGYNGAAGQYQFFIEDPNPNRPEIDIQSEPLRFTLGKPTIHVEIDWMQDGTHNYMPEQEVLNAIVDTFAQDGYTIQLELGNAIPYQEVLAVLIDGPSASPEVQAIKNAHFSHIGDSEWSYSIWGNNYSYNGERTGSSGIADLPGNTFLVTLGNFPNGVGLFSQKVGTFVHEFGHTLGQKHGGIDHNNWKPNYISIMNYFYQLDGITTSLTNLGFATNPTGFNQFGYSRGLQAPLDENNLSEPLGLGLNKAINWNCDADDTDTGVQKDIGGAGHGNGNWCATEASREVLTDFDNWSDISNYIRLGLRGRQSLREPATPCISWDEYSAFKADAAAKAAAEGRTLVEPPGASAYALPPTTNAVPNPQTFTIRNVGQQPLEITSIVPNPAAAYISLNPSGAFTIPAQSEQVVTVTVDFNQAPAGESTTRLVVSSNDADENPYPGQVYVVARNLSGGANPTPTPSPSPTPTPFPSDVSETVYNAIPVRVILGTTERATFVLRNAGNTDWTQAEGFKILASADGCGVFSVGQLDLNAGEVIPPGGTRTFSFDIDGGSVARTCTGALVMYSPARGAFGALIPFNIQFAAETADLANNPEGWFSGVVQGNGSVEANAGGLCAGVPDLGDNIAGWVSPNRYIPLKDLTAYQIRFGMTTTQTTVNEIPLISIIYDNAPYLTYGGELIVIDVADGGNGVGRPQGISAAELWAAPNAMATRQWRGTLDNGIAGENDNSMFTPAAEVGNDMRVVFRLLDTGSAGVNANIDDGNLCITSIQVRSHSYDALAPLDGQPVWAPPISSTQHAAETFPQAGAGTAQIDDINHLINYQLTASGAGSRKTLIPFDQRPEAPSALYPVDWLGDTLYRATVRLRSNVAGVEGSDPLDVFGILFDTRTVELVNTHVTLRGTIDYAHFAASPRLASTTGGEPQSYVAYFYSHNRSVLPPGVDPEATRFRAMADFLNFAEIAPDGQGTDAFSVTDMMVERVARP